MKKTQIKAVMEPDAAPIKLTLEAIYKDKIFEATTLRQPQWMRDGKRFSFLDNAPESEVTTVWIYDIGTGERTPIVPASALKLPVSKRPKKAEPPPDTDEDEDAPDTPEQPETLAIHGYQWSPDETRILFARIPHRRSATGDTALYVYTLATKTLKRVSRSEAEHRNVKWSPDGKYLGYVRADDLYLLELQTGKELRLTDTAAPNVYNGRFGWVYEEELDLVDGWAWSPDGRHIAYFRVDETPVPEIDLPKYDDLHMQPVRTRYPKAGDPNPIIKIGVIDLGVQVFRYSGVQEKLKPTSVNEVQQRGKSGLPKPEDLNTRIPEQLKTVWIDLGPDADIYISRMQWTPQGELMLHRMPRLQNRIDLLIADLATGACRVVLSDSDKAWVDARGDLTFVGSTDQFLWPSDRDGYNHLYLYNTAGKLLRQLTQGEWDVDAITGVDSTHRMAYFTAARPNPLERHLFSVLLDGGGDIVQLTDMPGTHSIILAPDGEHYLDTHSSRMTAPHVRLYRSSGQHVGLVQANPMPKLQNIPLGEWEFTSFKTGDGVTLNAAMLKPRDFNPKKKYPVLMFTYGGPGSQVVRDSYGNGGGLEQLLASKGYLFAMVDGRGSGMRGRDFMKVTYQNLGHYEVNDQIEGAKWLGSLPYIDAARIGIWGWSYGGYMAALCILRGVELFRTAVAVAPVTHWTLYDSIYTERYMRRPADNPKGYEQSSPITYVDKLKGGFLLVHGMADDNVHFQNTARLAAELQKQDKQFRLMAYPGKHHGMEGVSQHLFKMLTDFIGETL